MPNTVEVYMYMYKAYKCIVFKIKIFINEVVDLPEFDFEKRNQHRNRLGSSLPILRACVACILDINFEVFHY